MGAGLLGDEIGHRCLATGKQKSHMRVANTSSAEIAATFGKIQDETAPKPKKSEKFGDYAGQVPAQRVAGPKTPRKDTTGPMAPFPQQLTGPEVCGINSIAHKRGARQSRAGQSIVQTVVFKHPKHEGMVDNLKTIEPYMGAAGYCPGMEPSKTGPKYFPCKRVPYDIGNFPDEEARILENEAIEQGDNSMEQRQEQMKLGQVVTRRKSDLTRYAGVNLPTIFVSVGPGSMILNWNSHLPVMKNMANIFKICGVKRDMVRCVVVISCNWTQARPGFDVDIGLQKKPQRLLTDYSGAPAGNYIVNEYCPFGHPDVSMRIEALLRKANFTTALEKHRYLDSAAWLPLSLMPDAWDIPVVQISLPGVRKTGEDLDGSMIAKKALEMGYALRELRREGVLLLGCGHIYKGDALGAAESGLDKWVGGVKKACVQAPPIKRAGLLEQFSKIPYARRAASTDVSSLLPLHVVAGAGHGEPGQCMGDFRVGKGAMVHFKFGHDLYVEASK
jgi:4,5-DOPA dioxygenase extradiol